MKTKCLTCRYSLNCINGRYCQWHRVYTEHHDQGDCEEYEPRQ